MTFVPPTTGQQVRRRLSNVTVILPLPLYVTCIVSWPVNDVPSEPLTRKVAVNVWLLLRWLRLKLPHTVAWPRYVTPDATTAATEPVSVKAIPIPYLWAAIERGVHVAAVGLSEDGVRGPRGALLPSPGFAEPSPDRPNAPERRW